MLDLLDGSDPELHHPASAAPFVLVDNLVSVQDHVELLGVGYDSLLAAAVGRSRRPMWTVENRARDNRGKLRYPTDLTDAEWELAKARNPTCPARRK